MAMTTIQLLRGIGGGILPNEITFGDEEGEQNAIVVTNWKKLAKKYAPYVVGGAAVIYFGRKLLHQQSIPADQRARAERLRRASAEASRGMAGARRRRKSRR